MNKLLTSLGLAMAIATAGTLAGCELYFGDHGNNDNWNYCGSDGFYQCQGDNCTWVSSTCPAGGSSGGSDSCGSNADCSAGCYCALDSSGTSGTCEETGFCGSNADCGSGFFCDTARSTCEPNPPAPTCGSDSDCATGSICDASTGSCVATCTCTGDADAIAAGYGYCDTTRGTCEAGTNPNGSCAGTVTCNQGAPTCPSGQVALIENGCYSGVCEAIAECDAAPSCPQINDETDCLGRSDCSATYTGIDCTNAAGTACHAGDSGCTCADFEFASCATRSIAGRVVVDSSGKMVNVSSAQR